jgi:hypothetical protein
MCENIPGTLKRLLLFFHGHDFLPLAEPAVRADMVGENRFVTLGARGNAGGGEPVVGPAFVSPGRRMSSLWDSHS